jgi:hypothetical protein
LGRSDRPRVEIELDADEAPGPAPRWAATTVKRYGADRLVITPRGGELLDEP